MPPHFPASSTASGVCFAIPDVCKTPAGPAGTPPIPYPNTGQCATATGTEMMVCIENRPAIVQSSTIPRSQGDEPGVAGGVKSSTFGDQIAYKSFSSKVFIGGKKACMVTSVTAHNGSNANMPAGMQVAPSQVKVFVSL